MGEGIAREAALMHRKIFALCRRKLWRFAASFFCLPLWAGSAELPCTDSRKVDLQNTSIDVGDAGFDFHKGVASIFEDQELEWQATFKRDVTVDVAPGIPVRFMLIYNNHMNGSGWHFYFVGYGCFQRRMKQVFGQEGLSLKIDRVDEHAVVVAKILGYGNQAGTYFSYVWNGKREKYELNSTAVRK
jgi:hypothetical protein